MNVQNIVSQKFPQNPSSVVRILISKRGSWNWNISIQVDGENDVFHEIDSSSQFRCAALKMSRLLNYSRPIEPTGFATCWNWNRRSPRKHCVVNWSIYMHFESSFFFFFFVNRSNELFVFALLRLERSDNESYLSNKKINKRFYTKCKMMMIDEQWSIGL